MCQVENNNRGRILGDAVNNSRNLHVGSFHAIMQGKDNIVKITGVPPENDTTSTTVEGINKGSNGTTESSNSDINNQKKGNEVRVEDDAIDTISKSRDRFSKSDQFKVD